MSSLQCINCNIRLSRVRRHALTDESEDIRNRIRLWTYPRDITSSDHICHICWQLANNAITENVFTRPTGHRHICIACGRSVARTSRRRVFSEGANDDHHRLFNIISSWIQPRELTSGDEVCNPCWLKAQRRRRSISEPLPAIDPVGLPDSRDDDPGHRNNDPDHREDEPGPSDNDPGLLCSVCGQSLATTIPFDGQQNQDYIARLQEHQQMSSMHEVCGACWQQVQVLNSGGDRRPAQRPQYITLPNMRRAPETPRHCIFQECMESQRHVIPEETRRRVLLRFQFYIPRGARICTSHLQEAHFENLYSAEYSLDVFSTIHIEEIIFILMEGLHNVNYEDIQNYPDNQVRYFIGISKDEHNQILQATPRLRNMHRGSFALTALLCKLRTGDSGDRLSCLFQVPRRTLETLMSMARDILLSDYVPQYLGFNHLTRELVTSKNSYIADHIFGEPDANPEQKPAITIADATYIYLQKSSNYLFQKDTYSLHKYRNLVKPFLFCACDGYIIDVRGPYSATTNDATIMRDILNEPEFNNFYRENDIFLLDRGFRDCMDSLHVKGYIGHMPETKEDGQSQLTTLEANRSRCVTINRWVVEAVNGRIKRDFKIFRHEYFNRACPNLIKDIKIAAALLNAFSTPFRDNPNAEQFVNIIFDRLFLTNTIAELVAQNNLNRRGTLFVPIDGTTMSFPRLSMDDLTLFACGVYQIRQARSYVGEHFRFHGIYTLEVSRDRLNGLEGIDPILLRAKIKSRHSSSKTYFVFIVTERNMNGRDAILSYCCNCIVGLRTVGCCSHVMSIIWYLGYARHEGMTRPAPFLDEVVLRTD